MRPSILATAVVGVLATACDGGAPAPAGGAAVGDVAAGRQLFEGNCASCHGELARGTDQGPPLVHELYVPSHHADAAFLVAAQRGVAPHHWDFGAMPPVEGVDAAEVEAIVAYVRSLQREAGLIP